MHHPARALRERYLKKDKVGDAAQDAAFHAGRSSSPARSTAVQP